MGKKCTSQVVGIGNKLLCTVESADWHFFIRRLDGENYVPFSEFHKKEMTSADVAKFIPNWHTLRWIKIKNSMAGKSESYAKDAEFQVNVYSAEDSLKKHEEIVESFLTFMNQRPHD
jgi:hypothetical protein